MQFSFQVFVDFPITSFDFAFDSTVVVEYAV